MSLSPKLICKNVWKLYGDNPKEFLQNHNNNPDKEILETQLEEQKQIAGQFAESYRLEVL